MIALSKVPLTPPAAPLTSDNAIQTTQAVITGRRRSRKFLILASRLLEEIVPNRLFENSLPPPCVETNPKPYLPAGSLPTSERRVSRKFDYFQLFTSTSNASPPPENRSQHPSAPHILSLDDT
jgi:hypothetical protein